MTNTSRKFPTADGPRLAALYESPAGLRARARYRIEEAKRHPDGSAEQRRHLVIANEYLDRADAAQSPSG